VAKTAPSSGHIAGILFSRVDTRGVHAPPPPPAAVRRGIRSSVQIVRRRRARSTGQGGTVSDAERGDQGVGCPIAGTSAVRTCRSGLVKLPLQVDRSRHQWQCSSPMAPICGADHRQRRLVPHQRVEPGAPPARCRRRRSLYIKCDDENNPRTGPAAFDCRVGGHGVPAEFVGLFSSSLAQSGSRQFGVVHRPGVAESFPRLGAAVSPRRWVVGPELPPAPCLRPMACRRFRSDLLPTSRVPLFATAQLALASPSTNLLWRPSRLLRQRRNPCRVVLYDKNASADPLAPLISAAALASRSTWTQ
jgi:hypothetical protein